MNTDASYPPEESPSFTIQVSDGIQIRDPHSGRLAVTGEVKPRDSFWRKRLAEGAVKEIASEPEFDHLAKSVESKSKDKKAAKAPE